MAQPSSRIDLNFTSQLSNGESIDLKNDTGILIVFATTPSPLQVGIGVDIATTITNFLTWFDVNYNQGSVYNIITNSNTVSILNSTEANHFTDAKVTNNTNGSILTLVVNTGAYEAPVNLVANNITETTFDLSWDAVIGTVEYTVFNNGLAIGTSVNPTMQITGLTASTSYAMQVAVSTIDIGGNISSPNPLNNSAVLNVQTIASADAIPPSIPINLVSANVGQTTVDLSWDASTDNVGVVGYEVFKDGVSIGTPNTNTLNVTWLTANTAYTFTVTAKDAANNVSATSNGLVVNTLAIVNPPASTEDTYDLTSRAYYTGNRPLDYKIYRKDDAERDFLITQKLISKGHQFYHEADNKWYELDIYPTEGSLVGVVWKLAGGGMTPQQILDLANKTDKGGYTGTTNDLFLLVQQLGHPIQLKGNFDASTGNFLANTKAGYSYIVNVAGVIDGIDFQVDDRITSLVDNASTTVYADNWHKTDNTDNNKLENVSFSNLNNDLKGVSTLTQVDTDITLATSASWIITPLTAVKTINFVHLLADINKSIELYITGTAFVPAFTQNGAAIDYGLSTILIEDTKKYRLIFSVNADGTTEITQTELLA